MANTKTVSKNRLETYFDTTDVNLMAWYEFDSTGGSIEDLIGDGGDADIRFYAQVVDDSIGVSTRFNGNNYARVRSPGTDLATITANAQNKGMAVSIWVKPYVTETVQTIVGQEDGAGTGQSWISLYEAGGAIGNEIASNLGGVVYYTGIVPVLNQWYNIVLNYKPVVGGETYGRLTMWVNGVLPNNANPETDIDEGADGPVRFAMDKSTSEAFNGYSHQCLIYGRSLLDAEIAALYNKGVVQFHGGYGPPATGTITTDLIGDTSFKVNSGSFTINDETVDGQSAKVIECVTDGQFYAPVQELGYQAQEGAYGTYEWWMYKQNAGTLLEVLWCADTVGSTVAVGQDAYATVFDTDETIKIIESINGAPQASMITSGAKSAGSWIGIKATRSPAGLITLNTRGTGNGNDYIEEGTATDTTLTSSDYLVFDLKAGDKIAYGGISTKFSITKNLTVK